MRKGLIGLLFLLLVPVVLWLTLPWTAQYLLQQWLQQQGFERPQLVIQYPSWQRLHIDHISVGQRNDGHRLQLEAHNIEIRFHPLALLRGQIEELRIEQAELGIEANASGQAPSPPLQQTSPVALKHFQPAQLFNYAPSKRLVIAQLLLGYSAPGQPQWQARGNLDLEPELLQGRLQLQRNQTTLGYLDLSLDPDLNLALSLSRDNRYLLRSAHRLTPSPLQPWRLRSDLLVDTEYLPEWLELMTPELHHPVAEPSGQVRLSTRLNLPNPLPTEPSALLNALELELEGEASLNTASGPGFASSTSRLQVSAHLNSGIVSLMADKDSQIKVTGIETSNLSVNSLALRLTQPLLVEGHWLTPATWKFSAMALEMTPDGLALPTPSAVNLAPFQVRIDGGDVARPVYPFNVNLPRISLKPEQQPALDLALQAELKLDRTANRISGEARVDSLQLPLHMTLEGSVERDLTGRMEFQLPTTRVPALYKALQPWLPGDLSPLSIQQGTLSGRGNIQFSDNGWSLEAKPAIRRLNLIWDEHTRVIDVDLSQHLRLSSTGQLRSNGRLEVDHTDSGIRVFGPRLDFDFSLPTKGSPRLSLSSFSLSALDGIIAVPPLSFNPLHPEIQARIAVSALELERMLELYPQEGLYGSGVLGGALPIQIEGNRLTIRNGQLISGGEGGVIRYQPTPEVTLMGQQNPGIQLALDALTDLRFELLDLTLDYAPSGDAIMRARLKGYNPEWQQGRPVDLNLNIEENLLDLLRTLRLTDNVTDAIDRRFKR
ncbi:intermembrane phospholipid transport protein YdbH family protein [Marinobacterium sediminicola]|uniref:Dicarboxylate transport n=1 Tax=Marinobacterium sediminicola TaxID=518898 RepID=A0ABY1S3X5_9GAMM|nr:YdbH domain-containing protein [Marinobacterium sediminicola]ULG68193.1 YdbH domain-containing protein [Marinobacterium sediminicola]SMR77720.1 Dicarboxylate transport [Marinobacterium sediminicola]